MTRCESSARIHLVLAGIAHLVERHLAKVEVASSSLVARSRVEQDIRLGCPVFLLRRENSLPNTVAPLRFAAFGESRKTWRILESSALHPPQAALALLSTHARSAFQSEVRQGSRESPSSSQTPYLSGLSAAKPSLISLFVLSPPKPFPWVSAGAPVFVGCREASSSLVARSKLRKSPKAMKKALGLFSCAGRTFSLLSHRNRCAGFRREPCCLRTSDLDIPFPRGRGEPGLAEKHKAPSRAVQHGRAPAYSMILRTISSAGSISGRLVRFARASLK